MNQLVTSVPDLASGTIALRVQDVQTRGIKCCTGISCCLSVNTGEKAELTKVLALNNEKSTELEISESTEVVYEELQDVSFLRPLQNSDLPLYRKAKAWNSLRRKTLNGYYNKLVKEEGAETTAVAGTCASVFFETMYKNYQPLEICHLISLRGKLDAIKKIQRTFNAVVKCFERVAVTVYDDDEDLEPFNTPSRIISSKINQTERLVPQLFEKKEDESTEHEEIMMKSTFDELLEHNDLEKNQELVDCVFLQAMKQYFTREQAKTIGIKLNALTTSERVPFSLIDLANPGNFQHLSLQECDQLVNAAQHVDSVVSKLLVLHREDEDPVKLFVMSRIQQYQEKHKKRKIHISHELLLENSSSDSDEIENKKAKIKKIYLSPNVIENKRFITKRKSFQLLQPRDNFPSHHKAKSLPYSIEGYELDLLNHEMNNLTLERSQYDDQWGNIQHFELNSNDSSSEEIDDQKSEN